MKYNADFTLQSERTLLYKQ